MLSVVCALVLLASSPLTQAQGVTRVAVLAPAPMQDAFREALAVELAARAAEIVESTDGADFVVRLVDGDGGASLDLRAAGSERALRSPRLDATDPRTLAVVAASLLDEALEPDAAPARETPAAVDPATARIAADLDAPSAVAPPAEPPFFRDPRGRATPTPPHVVAEHGAVFGVDLGGVGFVNHTHAGGGGPLLRVRGGYRYRRVFRATLSLEGAVPTQEDAGGVELQGLLLPCAEISAGPEIGPVTLHIGARACLFLQEWRFFSFTFGSFDEERVVSGYAAGGFVGGSIYVGDDLALWLRADLAGAEPDLIDPVSETDLLRRRWALFGGISVGFLFE